MTEPISGPARAYVHPPYLDEASFANIPDPADAALDLLGLGDERGLVPTADVLRPLFEEWARTPSTVLPYPVLDPKWRATLARVVLDAFGGAALPRDAVSFGDGAYELWKELCGFVLRKGTLLGAGPVYPEFAGFFEAAGGRFRAVNRPDAGFPRDELLDALDRDDDAVAIYADLPYNATGELPGRAAVLDVVERAGRRDVLVILDEAYANFLGRAATWIPDVAAHENLVVIRSLSKGYDLRGLRFAFVVAGARVRPALLQIRSPYAPSQPAARAALKVLSEAPDLVGPLTDAIRPAKARVVAAARAAGLSVRATAPAAPNLMLAAPEGDLAAALAKLGVRVARGTQFSATSGGVLDRDVRMRTPLAEARLAAFESALASL